MMLLKHMEGNVSNKVYQLKNKLYGLRESQSIGYDVLSGVLIAIHLET